MPLLRNLRPVLSELSRNSIAIILSFAVTSAAAGNPPAPPQSRVHLGHASTSHPNSALAPVPSAQLTPAWTPPLRVAPAATGTAPVGIASLSQPNESPAQPEAVTVTDRETGKRAAQQPLKDSKLREMTHQLQSQSPAFIENRGQFDSRVKFKVTGKGGTLWLTNDGIVFDLVRAKDGESPTVGGRRPGKRDKRSTR